MVLVTVEELRNIEERNLKLKWPSVVWSDNFNRGGGPIYSSTPLLNVSMVFLSTILAGKSFHIFLFYSNQQGRDKRGLIKAISDENQKEGEKEYRKY